MRIFSEYDQEEGFVEIWLTEHEIKRLLQFHALTEIKNTLCSKRNINFCVRRREHATQKGIKQESD